MNPLDVPSPIDFHDPVQARAWVEETVNKRPWRPEFFQAFTGALNGHAQNPLQILELGSGPGHLAAAIVNECRVAGYVALDFSLAMHDLAREHLGPLAERVEFIQRDFRKPHWNDGLDEFDAVVTLQSAHETRHRYRLPPLLRQTRECLKPGGILLFCDHYLELEKIPELYLERGARPGALYNARFEDVECLLDKGGMALYRAMA